MQYPDQFSYFARLIRVVDGDTIEVELDLGLRIYHKAFIRFYGVDTPEMNRKPQREAAEAATAVLDRMVELYRDNPTQSHIYDGRIYVQALDFDKYANRIIGMVYFPGFKLSLNGFLVRNGLAKVYGQGTWTGKRLAAVSANAAAMLRTIDADTTSRGLAKIWAKGAGEAFVDVPQDIRASEFGVN